MACFRSFMSAAFRMQGMDLAVRPAWPITFPRSLGCRSVTVLVALQAAADKLLILQGRFESQH